MKIASIILAAGASSRLGHAKQLIKINQKYILETLYQDLCQLSDATWVVTGCYHDEMSKQFPDMNLLYNRNWGTGMGSSISYGIDFLKSEFSHILICVCDQALIKRSHYEQLLKTSKNNQKNIIATYYKTIMGVPAMFPSKYFSELIKLNSTDQGARKIISKFTDQVITINSEMAKYDIDNPNQLSEILNIKNNQ